MATFKHRSSLTTVERTFDVSGAADIASRFASYVFRPDTATVTFEDDEFAYLKVAGANVKKDGTTGAIRHDSGFSEIEAVPADLLPLTNPNFEG